MSIPVLERLDAPLKGHTWEGDHKPYLKYLKHYNKRCKKEKEFEKRLLIKILEFIHLGYNNEEEVGLKVMELFNECVGIEELKRLTKPDGMLDALVNPESV